MSVALARTVSTREAAHQAAREAYHLCQRLIADGKQACIRAEEAEDQRSIQQNRFYFGVVLKEIAAQVQVGGMRYTAEAWHHLMKQKHLGYSFKRIQLPGKKRKSVLKELRSTTGLSVKKMSAYLEAVQVEAITELGVRFSCPDWQGLQP